MLFTLQKTLATSALLPGLNRTKSASNVGSLLWEAVVFMGLVFLCKEMLYMAWMWDVRQSADSTRHISDNEGNNKA